MEREVLHNQSPPAIATGKQRHITFYFLRFQDSRGTSGRKRLLHRNRRPIRPGAQAVAYQAASAPGAASSSSSSTAPAAAPPVLARPVPAPAAPQPRRRPPRALGQPVARSRLSRRAWPRARAHRRRPAPRPVRRMLPRAPGRGRRAARSCARQGPRPPQGLGAQPDPGTTMSAPAPAPCQDGDAQGAPELAQPPSSSPRHPPARQS